MKKMYDKFMRFMHYKNYRGKTQWFEVWTDILVTSILTAIVVILYYAIK